jgi:peptidoglycan/LPS O-acetylase OafA/YrhL
VGSVSHRVEELSCNTPPRPTSVDQELQTEVRMGYRPELDGLRAVAVLAVVLYHLHGPQAPILGGFLGVDLFFVLSGFLITRLLLEDHRRRGSISLRSFYRRRMARLFPALAVVLAFVTLDAVTIGSGGPRTQLLAGVAATIGYSANWLWGTGHAFGTLDAMWSLSVEEQFYVVWPFAFLLIMRRGTIRTVR